MHLRPGRTETLTTDERIWAWRNGVWLAERDPARLASWGGAAASVRVTLRALAAAMQMTKSGETEFGCRDLALHAKIPYRTVAAALARLRDEDDPLIVRTRAGRGLLGDRYRMRIPDAYRDDVLWYRWRAGIIAPAHPAFWALGPAALLTWEALGSQPAPAAELARLAALSDSGVGRALRRLGEHGLAVRHPAGWTRGPAALDDVAEATGAWRLDEDIRREYERHRGQWKERLSNRPEPAAGFAPPAAPAAAVPRPRGRPEPSSPRAPPGDRESAVLLLLERELGARVIGQEPSGAARPTGKPCASLIDATHQ